MSEDCADPALPAALRLTTEREALDAVPLAELTRASLDLGGGGAGIRAVLEPHAPPAAPGVPPGLEAAMGGPVRPAWYEGRGLAELSVCRVSDAWHLPRFGAVIDGGGRVFASTVSEALQGLGDLGALPCVTPRDDGWSFTPPADASTVPEATVFMPWGAMFNYGHFLLDALPSLLAVEEAGLLASHPPICPPLNPWQRGLLALAFGDALPLIEHPAPVVRVGEAAFATSLDHFLNAPNLILGRLRERMRMRARAATRSRMAGPKRLYLSRRSFANTMRVMVNEAALERALKARGFAVVRPETLTAARQAALMLDAEVVVAPTGAALANVALTRPGTRIVEIQPEVFTSGWVHAFSSVLGQHWSVYWAAAPLPFGDVPLLRRARRGFKFGYRLPLEDFLSFLDARL